MQADNIVEIFAQSQASVLLVSLLLVDEFQSRIVAIWRNNTRKICVREYRSLE